MRRKPLPIFERQLVHLSPYGLPWAEGTLERHVYAFGKCLVLFTKEDHGEDGLWFHTSISRRDCYPSWEELKRVAELLFPKDAEVMQIVMTPDPWVNVHENCFHLWSPIGARLAPRSKGASLA